MLQDCLCPDPALATVGIWGRESVNGNALTFTLALTLLTLSCFSKKQTLKKSLTSSAGGVVEPQELSLLPGGREAGLQLTQGTTSPLPVTSKEEKCVFTRTSVCQRLWVDLSTRINISIQHNCSLTGEWTHEPRDSTTERCEQ